MIRQRLHQIGDLQTDVKPEAFHANAIVVLGESNCLYSITDLSSAPDNFETFLWSANPRIFYASGRRSSCAPAVLWVLRHPQRGTFESGGTVLIASITKMALKQPAHTCRPISSAKGNMYKSPTVETVAFPSSKAFAAFKKRSHSAGGIIIRGKAYLLDLIFGNSINRPGKLINLESLTTLNKSSTC